MPKPGGGKLTEKVEVIRAINAVVNWNKRSASTMHVNDGDAVFKVELDIVLKRRKVPTCTS